MILMQTFAIIIFVDRFRYSHIEVMILSILYLTFTNYLFILKVSFFFYKDINIFKLTKFIRINEKKLQ
jgi:hypothetical protein